MHSWCVRFCFGISLPMFILFHISVVVWAYLFLVFLILSSLLANRLAGKSVVSKMAYFVPSLSLIHISEPTRPY